MNTTCPGFAFCQSVNKLLEAFGGIIAVGDDAGVAVAAADRANVVGFRAVQLPADLHPGLSRGGWRIKISVGAVCCGLAEPHTQTEQYEVLSSLHSFPHWSRCVWNADNTTEFLNSHVSGILPAFMIRGLYKD